jgi:hypothetical protein
MVGVGAGLVAYYVGFQASASQGPDELRFVPSNASLVAYADVRAVMVSEVRRKLLDVVPSGGQGRQGFEQQTGINVETDIDRVVACTAPSPVNGQTPLGMVLARGRFNNTKIEALMREHGAEVQDYKGRRLLVADLKTRRGPSNVSLAFLEPGLVALGGSDTVRAAVDLADGGDNVTNNAELMDFVKSFDGNAWAVGRFDALRAQANLPQTISSQIPPITWFAASARVNGGVNGLLRADARDEESASSLRDVVRGVVALARLQTGSHPELQSMVDSIQLGGTGKTVTLSFDVSPEVFDTLATTLQGFGRGRGRP